MPAPRRIVIALVIAGAVFCAAAATALAAGNPGRQPLEPRPDVTIQCPQGYTGPDDSITAIFHGLTVRIPRTDAGLWVYTGLVSVDPRTGNILSHSGSVRDICAELA